MSTEKAFRDTRLLEALEYIDKRYIAEVFDDMKVPSMPEEYVPGKRSPFKYWRQFVAAAAVLLLLSMASPITNFVVETVRSIAAGWGSETTLEESSNVLENEDTVSLNDTTENSDFVLPETNNTIVETENIETEPVLDYLKFSAELEEIDEETMLKVKTAWSQFWYEAYYTSNYPSYIKKGYSEEDAKAMAIKDATEISESEFNHFFDSVYFYFYGYLGTINDNIVLASYSNRTKPLNGLTIGGVEFGTQARFYIYSNEKIIKLEEAYENELVSYEDLLLIKSRNEQYRDVAFEYYANQFKEAQQGKG